MPRLPAALRHATRLTSIAASPAILSTLKLQQEDVDSILRPLTQLRQLDLAWLHCCDHCCSFTCLARCATSPYLMPGHLSADRQQRLIFFTGMFERLDLDLLAVTRMHELQETAGC